MDTLFFWDGIRKIDMVLPYDDDEEDTRRKEKRRTFEKFLVEQGLELETEPKEVSTEYCNINHVKKITNNKSGL